MVDELANTEDKGEEVAMEVVGRCLHDSHCDSQSLETYIL